MTLPIPTAAAGAGTSARPDSPNRLIPLTDFPPGASYRGEDGGLYGEGCNAPPESHLRAALREAVAIRPLDHAGDSNPAGRIGLLCVGFSNAWQEFRDFERLARRDLSVSPLVCGVNAAQHHLSTIDWATALEPPGGPWKVMEERREQLGISRGQIQVAWIKLASKLPAQFGEFPATAVLEGQALRDVLCELRHRYPNLRLAYLSSRTYAGYASTPLSPEPWAYEGAFVIRRLIGEQIRGDPSLAFDSAHESARVPLLLWGPYLWAAGLEGRKVDDLVWAREDFAADGTHPSSRGIQKVARLLLDFLKTNRTSAPWFRA
jgi:hypothetical protein